jgi:hypothetical protein
MLLATSRVLTDKGGQHGYGASGPARDTNGHPPRVRRSRHRRWRRRSLSTLQVARTRLAGSDLRNGQRGRRHLVLEPLSRRALRLRKLDVRLLVSRGSFSRIGSGKSTFRPNPTPSATSTTSPTNSTCGVTSNSTAASSPRTGARRRAAGSLCWRAARAIRRAFSSPRSAFSRRP